MVQPNGTGWDRLEYVVQVGQGQGGLHIGWDRMGLGQGCLQIRWDRLGQWTGLCPAFSLSAEPVHSSQSEKWDYKLKAVEVLRETKNAHERARERTRKVVRKERCERASERASKSERERGRER